MATYCIGDIHACYNEFMKLLELIKFDDKKDELILTGDLIGRGPLPVETMKEIMGLGKCVNSVLGNHDLNFLAVAKHIVTPRPKDNLEVILRSPLFEEIVNYLTNLPLLYKHKEKQLVVVHAGIYPLWELSTAKKVAKELPSPFRREGWSTLPNTPRSAGTYMTLEMLNELPPFSVSFTFNVLSR